LLARANAFLGEDLLGSAKAVLGLAALVVYGIVRIGLDAFYNSLGLRAEDVGLTQLVVITRAAMSFVLVLFIGALLMILIVETLSSGLRRRLESSDTLRQQLGQRLTAGDLPSAATLFYAVAWTGVVLLALVLFLSMLLIKGGFIPGAVLTIAAGLIFTLWLIRSIGRTAMNIYADAIEHPTSEAAPRIRSFRSVIILTSLVLTALLTLMPWVSGRLIAEDVKAGKTYIPDYVVGLPVIGSLDVRAECVTVKKKSDGSEVGPRIAPDRVLYLGQGDGFLVFYQTHVGPFRLPAGDFILTSIKAKTC
jgi:diacylglycerol kinase